MSLTSIIGKFFVPRQHELERHLGGGEALQRQVLAHLVAEAKDTEYGRNHLFSATRGYDDFARNVPVNTYEELKGDIDRMRHGEADVLWPGRVRWYAKSSGTTNDKSKFIPVSPQGLKDTHYRGGQDCVALYLRNNPKSRMFDGKALILGGSHAPNYNLPHSLVGDLSAILIENASAFVNHFRVPEKSIALLSDFEKKREDGQVLTRLTALGQRVFRLNYKERQLKLVSLMLEHQIFAEFFDRMAEAGELPDQTDIADEMRRLHVCGEGQIVRRASSVYRWLGWIRNLTRL